MTPFRYVRALWKTLLIMLRGEKIAPAPLHQPRLHEWMRAALRHIDGVRSALDRAGMTMEQRKAFVLHIDKRDVALETVLQGIRHHMTIEYPYMLKNYTRYSVMTINASNMNDQYMALRFADAEALPEGVRAAWGALRDHLAAIPPADPDVPGSEIESVNES
jgi:hypothetical protein